MKDGERSTMAAGSTLRDALRFRFRRPSAAGRRPPKRRAASIVVAGCLALEAVIMTTVAMLYLLA
jgi:hypothetical protein